MKNIYKTLLLDAFGLLLITQSVSAESGRLLVRQNPAYKADGTPYTVIERTPVSVQPIQGQVVSRTKASPPQVTIISKTPAARPQPTAVGKRAIATSSEIKVVETMPYTPRAEHTTIENLSSIDVGTPAAAPRAETRPLSKGIEVFDNYTASHPERPESFIYTDINEAFRNEDSVKQLDLSGQNLSRLPRGLSQLQNLTHLDLSNNYLTSIPPEVMKLPNLKILNLANNDIDYIPDEIGNLTAVESLDFEGNQINEIPYAVDGLFRLTNVNFKGNPIPEWQVEELRQSLSRARISF